MVFCSQTLSPAPTERRPPTFVAGAVCLSKPVPGSATNVAGAGSAGVSPAYSLVLDSKGAVDFCSQTLSPAPTERRPPTFVAGAVSSARGQSRVFTCFGLEERHGFLLSNPFSGADGASPSNFWMGARFAFRNPFRVPLRTGFGILSFDSVRDGGGENPLLQPGEAGNSVEMGVARIEDE